MNWHCPFCGRHTTVNSDRVSDETHWIRLENKLGLQALHSMAIACPNKECQELYVVASLGSFRYGEHGREVRAAPHSKWTLRPQAAVKVIPDYVPAPIVEDYREACLIRDLSPKASATLSRRCLQGMIRDFWNIRKARLIDEIKGLEDVVDAATWRAIDSVREIGNIGAHMEKDINVIVDVDPSEASLLIELIETLIDDWYVERHERAQRMARVVEAAAAKKAAKQGVPSPGVVGTPPDVPADKEPT
jgi:hypothetical protein